MIRVVDMMYRQPSGKIVFKDEKGRLYKLYIDASGDGQPVLRVVKAKMKVKK